MSHVKGPITKGASETTYYASQIDYVEGLGEQLDSIDNSIIAEGKLRQSVDAEIKEDVSNLWNDFHNEIEDRNQSDSDLQRNIDNEESARITADNDLRNAIDTETSNRVEANNDLQTALNSESKARRDADAQLKAEIDNDIKTLQSC